MMGIRNVCQDVMCKLCAGRDGAFGQDDDVDRLKVEEIEGHEVFDKWSDVDAECLEIW